jgi:hypothetical protein
VDFAPMKRKGDAIQNEPSKRINFDGNSITTEEEYTNVLKKLENGRFEKFNYFNMVHAMSQNQKTHSWIYISRSDSLSKYHGRYIEFLPKLVKVALQFPNIGHLVTQFLSVWLDHNGTHIDVLDSIPHLISLPIALYKDWILNGLFTHFSDHISC